MVAIISVSVGRRINFGPFAANYKRNQQDKEVKSMTRIDIISGFLGAGKTTLIKKLLGDALKGQQVVLIENEFGEIGIDGGDHHHHHHADEVFTSWGQETVKTFTKEQIEGILKKLSEDTAYGMVLRAKGMVAGADGQWIYFDMVPEEYEVRDGAPEFTGRICVIGSKLAEDKLAELFGL